MTGELLEIIEWNDDSRDTLSHRYPDHDRAIKRGAQLVVRDSQAAQFVYLGQFADTYGPGTYTLVTGNTPILTRLAGWKYGLESPFKTDVYFITTRLFPGNQWGTANPVMLHDKDLGIVRARAFGTYDFRVCDPQRFLHEVAGTGDHFRLDDFSTTMRSRIVSVFSDALANSHIPVAELATRFTELGQALLPLINPALTGKYGLEITSLVVENVSVPPEVEQAMDKAASMTAIGNLNDYVKYQMAQGFEKGVPGTAGVGAELAVGMSVAQQIMKQQGGLDATAPPGDVLSAAQVARLLSVPESDVIASLEKGDLKGRQIGAEWRVTRTAVDQFLRP
jgi:excisionase family DNA binding protein